MSGQRAVTVICNEAMFSAGFEHHHHMLQSVSEQTELCIDILSSGQSTLNSNGVWQGAEAIMPASLPVAATGK